ncbi:MAG: 3-hydroxyacyl-CoA dehydrogenase NAD-binding domain-containing protein [Acidobacteriaceae bacterium]
MADSAPEDFGGIQRTPRSPIRDIAIIGAGPLGRSFAFLCARKGFHAVLEDVLPSNQRRAQAALEQSLAEETLAGSLGFATSVEDAVREADIVIDFVPDELESKLEILSLVDRMAPPKTMICTPSEALSITDIASCTYRAEGCTAVRVGDGAAHLAEAAMVRILRSPMTSQETIALVTAMFAALGKETQVEDDPEAPVFMHNAHFAKVQSR